ncbi:MAG TPA: TIGR03089 family protein [Propionibacteriaceae bacterium]|nr:TIGR03089 family protein [Propionibacteriaceae bacterium]
MVDIVDALRHRVRTAGAQPLLTYYDLDRNERIELSAVSFANWVDKTCHLLDELELGPGEQLAVPVVAERPGHWAGLVAVMAGWQMGAHVVVDPTPGSLVAVTGPDNVWAVIPPTWLTVVACSLHPLGLPLHPPAPVIDFADVLSQPDVGLTFPHSAGDPAWEDLSYGDLASLTGETGRRLLRATDPAAVLDGLVAPVLGGGSAVIVAGQGDAGRIAEAERAVALG